MQRTVWVILGLMVFIFAGCLNGGVKLEVQYDDLVGIQEGDRVLSENETVGVVTKVNRGENADGPGSVFVSVNKKRADTLLRIRVFTLIRIRKKRRGKPLCWSSFVQVVSFGQWCGGAGL